jgi:opacity protein-like surface antigen
MRRSLLAIIILLSPATSLGDEDPPDLRPQPVQPQPQPQPQPTVAAQPAASLEPTVVLGLGVGAYIPTSKLKTNFLVGIDAAYQLPWIGRKIGVGMGLAYSQPTTSGQLTDTRAHPPDGLVDYESTMRELVLDVLFTYRFLSWSSIWSPHAGIGPSFYFLSHNVSALGVDQSETSTQVGFLFVAGVDFRVWRGALIGEIRVPFATVGQRTTGESNVGAVSIVFGYRFRI